MIIHTEVEAIWCTYQWRMYSVGSHRLIVYFKMFNDLSYSGINPQKSILVFVLFFLATLINLVFRFFKFNDNIMWSFINRWLNICRPLTLSKIVKWKYKKGYVPLSVLKEVWKKKTAYIILVCYFTSEILQCYNLRY